jgi:hypothetical protein
MTRGIATLSLGELAVADVQAHDLTARPLCSKTG